MESPTVNDESGNAMPVDFVSADDSTIHDLPSVIGALQTVPFVPSGTHGTIRAARKLMVHAGNSSNVSTILPMLFDVVDAQSGTVLSHETAQIADDDSSINGSDMMNMSFNHGSGRSVILRIRPLPNAIADKFTATLWHLYAAGDTNAPKSIAEHDRFAEPKPTTFKASNNYPNPFNPTTTLDYQLAAPGYVNIVVYNSLGQEIKRLVDGQREAGYYNVQWNAGNSASGLYFIRVNIVDQSGTQLYRDVKKVMLVK